MDKMRLVLIIMSMVGYMMEINGQQKPDGGISGIAPPAVEPIVIDTPTGKLFGTLLVPAEAIRPPVVILIAGSGPTNRDGNSPAIPGANNSLKYLAEGLAARGLAVLRFDKRGIGESAGAFSREDDLRFETYIDDVVSWGTAIRAGRRFSSLTIAGHSEGSLIGMVAARKLKADGFVSIAGIGRPASAVLLEQLKPSLPAELFQQSEAILKELEAGRLVKDVPGSLAALFRPSVQPYMVSWLKYDPAAEIAKLDCPILIAQGTTDIQVGVLEARTLAKAKPSAGLLILEGMNHVLKDVPADREKQISSYGDPGLPVDPALIDGIAKLVGRLGK